jgi:hypothetical protein
MTLTTCCHLTDAFGLTAVRPDLNFSQSGHLPGLKSKSTLQNDPRRLICRRDVVGALWGRSRWLHIMETPASKRFAALRPPVFVD